MKKGFTIIELLAVITLLAIVTMIAVPIILNVINTSKESSYEEKAKLFIKNIENKIAQHQIENILVVDGEYQYNSLNSKICLITNTNICIEDLDIEANKPDSVDIEISDYEIIYYELEYSGKSIIFGSKGE